MRKEKYRLALGHARFFGGRMSGRVGLCRVVSLEGMDGWRESNKFSTKTPNSYYTTEPNIGYFLSCLIEFFMEIWV